MKKKIYISIAFLCIFILIPTEKTFPQVSNASHISNYNFSSDNFLEEIELPKSLKEISGLTFFGQSEILTHNDEEGIIYKFNIKSREVTGKIKIGDKKIEKDFEGITLVKDSVYLITSAGILYKLHNSFSDVESAFKKFSTSLTSKNDVEGLCYDRKSNLLLIACKEYPGKGYKGSRAIYTFSLTSFKLSDKPKYTISLDELKKKYGLSDFKPSAIEINPLSGNFVLLSSNPAAILEMDGKGRVLNCFELNKKKFKQPEGVTFFKDGTMIISDEAQKKSGKLIIVTLNRK